jgi:hypothetical protein
MTKPAERRLVPREAPPFAIAEGADQLRFVVIMSLVVLVKPVSQALLRRGPGRSSPEVPALDTLPAPARRGIYDRTRRGRGRRAFPARLSPSMTTSHSRLARGQGWDISLDIIMPAGMRYIRPVANPSAYPMSSRIKLVA